ncbi:hypothetical protein CIB48_g7566 [Xylaria polymorpha]|nr:hypothetical protein CIB48_g7566 [Xylaria polymorpha]
MRGIEYTAQSLADQAHRLSMFTVVSKHDPDDKFFLVMGITGCGKSAFVSHCTGKHVTTSSGLYSCTDLIDVYDFMFNGRRIHLIDTPGFNDTNRSDIEILGVLASWLGASYGNGPAEPTDPQTATLEARETELLGDDKFFGFFVERNAHLLRYNQEGNTNFTGETTSGRRIVLQREIVDQGKTLGETAAGIAAANELYKERKAHEQYLEDLRADMSRHLDESNAAYAAQLRELEADAEKKLKKADDDRHMLKQRMEDWHENELNALEGKMEEIIRSTIPRRDLK